MLQAWALNRPERAGASKVLRATTYFAALLVVSSAALLALVASSLPDVTRITLAAFGVTIAAELVLLVHQPIGRMSALSTILMALAFILPAILVRETSRGGLCGGGPTPCDPGMNSHTGIRLGLMAILLFPALIAAVVGVIRSSRPTNAPHPRVHELA